MSGKVRTKVNNKNQAKPDNIKEAIVYKNKFGLNPYLLPLMFVLCILPLIIHVKVYRDYLEDCAFFYSNEYGESSDVFLYYKMVFFITSSCIMLALLVVRTFFGNLKLSFVKLFVPLGGYALLAFLSAVFSKNSSFSFSGIYEHFESVWVLLGYALTAYYAFLIVSTAKDLEWLMRALTVGTIIMFLLGLSQAFSHDFIRSDFAADMLIPSEILKANPDAKLEFLFPLDRVYLTLYNPNYVGSYVSLLSPVFLMYGFAKKNLKMLILNIVIYLGLLMCLLGSGSRAGFIGIFFSLLLLGIIYNKKLIKYIPELMIGIVLVVGTVYTYNNYTNGQLTNRVKSALEIEPYEPTLKGIDTNKDNLTIHYKDNDLVLMIPSDRSNPTYDLFTFDGTGAEVAYTGTYNEEEVSFNYVTEDPRFKSISIKYVYTSLNIWNSEVHDIPAFIINIDGKTWRFIYLNTKSEDKTGFYYFTKQNKPSKMNNAANIESMTKYGRAFSGRFFIWSYTLPLLKDNIILGTGPDTFILNFPNDDYVAMDNYGYGDEVMTKPHNMYLQIAVQTGVLSLICFLVFYFWYFISSIRLFRKADRSQYTVMLGIGILCGTFGYMIVGLINDSMIVTAPLFWCLTGTGIAINFMIKRDELFAVIDNVKPEAKAEDTVKESATPENVTSEDEKQTDSETKDNNPKEKNPKKKDNKRNVKSKHK